MYPQTYLNSKKFLAGFLLVTVLVLIGIPYLIRSGFGDLIPTILIGILLFLFALILVANLLLVYRKAVLYEDKIVLRWLGGRTREYRFLDVAKIELRTGSITKVLEELVIWLPEKDEPITFIILTLKNAKRVAIPFSDPAGTAFARQLVELVQVQLGANPTGYKG